MNILKQDSNILELKKILNQKKRELSLFNSIKKADERELRLDEEKHISNLKIIKDNIFKKIKDLQKNIIEIDENMVENKYKIQESSIELDIKLYNDKLNVFNLKLNHTKESKENKLIQISNLEKHLETNTVANQAKLNDITLHEDTIIKNNVTITKEIKDSIIKLEKEKKDYINIYKNSKSNDTDINKNKILNTYLEDKINISNLIKTTNDKINVLEDKIIEIDEEYQIKLKDIYERRQLYKSNFESNYNEYNNKILEDENNKIMITKEIEQYTNNIKLLKIKKNNISINRLISNNNIKLTNLEKTSTKISKKIVENITYLDKYDTDYNKQKENLDIEFDVSKKKYDSTVTQFKKEIFNLKKKLENNKKNSCNNKIISNIQQNNNRIINTDNSNFNQQISKYDVKLVRYNIRLKEHNDNLNKELIEVRMEKNQLLSNLKFDKEKHDIENLKKNIEELSLCHNTFYSNIHDIKSKIRDKEKYLNIFNNNETQMTVERTEYYNKIDKYQKLLINMEDQIKSENNNISKVRLERDQTNNSNKINLVLSINQLESIIEKRNTL